MRRFLNRIIICLIPVVVSIAVVVWAYIQFENGRGGFRLGVDLAGGTILVYEVDEAKIPADFQADKLADALKKRIDPNDLYNITIRPISGTPPRVEIILPTGGIRQARAEKRNWEQLIKEVNQRWPTRPYSQVRSGDRAALIEAVASENPDARADVRAFVDEHKDEKWEDLVKEVEQKWPGKPYGRVRVGELANLVDVVASEHPDVPRPEISTFIEQHSGGSKDQRLLTSAQVDEIKALIEKQGRLEFEILANREDDEKAISAAEAYFKDPKNADELKRLEVQAKEPPPPRNKDDNSKFFPVTLPDEPPHSYRWVELDKSELWSLRYNSAALARPENRAMAEQIERARKSGQPFTEPRSQALIYTREITDWSRRLLKDREQGKKAEYFVLIREPREPRKEYEVTGDYLNNASEGQDQRGRRAIHFGFNGEGGNRFYEVTSKNKPTGSKETGFKRHLAILFDDKVVSAPALNSPIRDRGIIEGEFTPQEVTYMVRVMRAGALPATLKKDPVSQNSMGATLGDDTIEWGTKSVLWAFIAVLAFMIFYYRFAGVVACVALFANLLLTVAFMVVVKAAFTLPGLAGLVLMLGMAVDANVLIYERLREERDRGASIAMALRNGYDRAFPTIIDTHLSSIFTAIVLYVVGNDQLKGFGISLTVGLLISLFTSLYMTRTMFEVFLAEGWLRDNPRVAGLEAPRRMAYASPVKALLGAAIALVFSAGLVVAVQTDWFTAPFDLDTLRSSWGGATAFVVLVTAGTYLAISHRWFDPTEGLHFIHIQFNLGKWHFDLHDPKIDFMAIRYYWFTATIILTVLGGAIFFYRVGSKDESCLNIDFRGGTTYTAQLNAKMNLAQLRDKLETGTPLPDMSIEQVFLSSDTGNESKMFTVRTSEIDKQRVFRYVNERMGDELKRIKLDHYEINPAGTEATLFFGQTVDGTFQPDYASPGQIQELLRDEFAKYELPAGGYSVDRAGEEKDEHFSQLKVKLNRALKPGELKQILDVVKGKLRDIPQPERLENFDKQLASSTQERAMYAILASWAAIMLYLWFRFGSWTFGAATVLCLIHDLFFTLGVIAGVHYVYKYAPGLAWVLRLQDFKFDLGSVAALLTLVGYSVNDTIVVFDRIREVRGKNPILTAKMINDSVNQTLSRTLLASMTVWVVVIVLYLFGGEGVKLFAFVMVVGVIVGTYSSIYIASPLLLIFGEGADGEDAGRIPAQTAVTPG